MKKLMLGSNKMKFGNVKIISVTKEPDIITAAAAMISHKDGTADELIDHVTNMSKSERIKKIRRVPHPSILEHAYVNIEFNDVSMFVEQFMIEHRLAAYTVKSRRYVNFTEAGYNLPTYYLSENKHGKEIIDLMEGFIKEAFGLYKKAIDVGMNVEDARYVLPCSFRSNFFVSVDVRIFETILLEMIHEDRHPLCREIKEYGIALINEANTYLPFMDTAKILSYEKPETKPGAVFNKILDKSIDNTDRSLIRASLEDINDDVEIINYSFHDVQTVVRTYLARYGVDNVSDECIDILTYEYIDDVMKEILSFRNKRELENITYTFMIHNISLAAYTHLTRHRMQTLNTPSIIDVLDDGHYVCPAAWLDHNLFIEYSVLYQKCAETINKLLELGVEKRDVIYCVLCGYTIPVSFTMNANELKHVFGLRCCNRAQWEIRSIANDMLVLLRKLSPEIFNYFGSNCYMCGKCPEGKMSCGKMAEMLDLYDPSASISSKLVDDRNPKNN